MADFKSSGLSSKDFVAANQNLFDETTSKGFQSYIENTNEATRSAEGLSKATIASSESAKQANSSFKSVGIVGKAASFGLNVLSSVLTTLAVQAAMFAVTEGGKWIWENVINATDTAIKKGKEAQTAFDDIYKSFSKKNTSVVDLAVKFTDNSSEINSTSSAIEALGKKYDTLSDGVNRFTNENESLSTEDYQEYLDISNQLAELFPELVSGYDEQGNALLNLGTGAQSTTEHLQSLLDVQRQIANTDMSQSLNDIYNGIIAQDKKYDSQLNTLDKKLETKQTAKNELESNILPDIDSLAKEAKTITASQDVLDSLAAAFHAIGFNNYTPVTSTSYNGNEIKNAIQMNQTLTQDQLAAFKEILSQPGYNSKLNQYSSDIANILKEKQTMEMQKEDNIKKLATYASQYIKTSNTYSELDESIQSALTNNLGNIVDLDTIQGKYKGGFENYIYEEILSPFYNLSDKQKLSISSLFDLDEDEYTLSEYTSKINDILYNIFPDDMQRRIDVKKLLGFDNLENDLELKTDKLKEKFERNIQSIDNMTIGDRELLYKLAFEDDYSDVFEDCRRQIERMKHQAETPIEVTATPEYDQYEEDAKKATPLDQYNKFKEAYDKVKTLYEEGKVGDYAFKSGAKMFSPGGYDDAENFKENQAKIERYFTEDPRTGMNNLLQDMQALNKGYATFKDGQWDIDLENMAQAAEDVGIAFEPFMSILTGLNEYGANGIFFSTVKDGTTKLTDLYSELADAELELNNIDPEVDPEGFERAKTRVDELNQSIEKTSSLLDVIANKDVETREKEVAGAAKTIENLIKERDSIKNSEYSEAVKAGINSDIEKLATENNLKLDRDESNNIVGVTLEVKNPEEPVQKAQEMADGYPLKLKVVTEYEQKAQDAYDEYAQHKDLRTQLSLTANTSDADSKVKQAETKANDTKATMAINADNSEAKAKIDETVSYAESKNPFVKVKADTSQLVSGINTALSGKTFSIAVKGNVSVSGGSGGSSKSSAKAHGTPFIRSAIFNDGYVGKAYSSGGTVGEPRDTEALTGELGEELIVRGNQFFTVGTHGAEIANLKAGDIVFNHEQTRQLLSNGRINSRGRALAKGNARVLASNRQGSGYSSIPGFNLSSTTASDTKATQENTDAKKANTSATNSSTKSTKKNQNIFDGIARKLKYFANKTKEIADQINDYIKSTLKASLLQRQIKSIDKEITVNEKGATAYSKAAASVKLNAKWKKRIREGDYNINEIKDDNLYKKITSYQTYYDKITECKQAVVDLKKQQLQLYEQWLNIPADVAQKKIDKLSASLKNLQSASANFSSGGSAIKQYTDVITSDYANLTQESNKELKTANKKVSKTQKAKAASKKAATKAGTKAKKSVKKKSKKVQKSVAKAVKNSKPINIKKLKLKGKAKKSAQAYNKKLAKYKKASSAAANARVEQINVSSQSAEYSKMLAEAQKISLEAASQEDYIGQNNLLDDQTKNMKQQNDANQTALNETTKNVASQKKASDAANKKAASQKTSFESKQSSIQNNKKIMAKLSKSQKADLKAGKTISTKGLKGNALKQIKEYNKRLKAMKAAQAAATAETQKLTMAQKAQATAAANAADSQAEYAKTVVDNEVQKFNNIKDYYDSITSLYSSLQSLHESQAKLKEAKGQELTDTDYNSQISDMRSQVTVKSGERQKLQEQLDASVASGVIVAGSKEWNQLKSQIYDCDTEINNLNSSIESLGDELRNDVFLRAFTKALENAEALRSAVESIKGLISDDMMFDDDGKLTDFGIANLALSLEDYQSALGSLQSLVGEREALTRKFNSKNEFYSKEDFEKDMKRIDGEVQSTLSTANSNRQAIISIITSQSKAELDALFKVIEARKEALKKKKDYYDYDKTLKNKTKEINILKQQIDALDGVTDAEAKAKKAQLEASLQEKQDDLDDTVKDHVYNLQVDGLDELKDTLQENYDNYVKDLARNLDAILDAVNGATSTVVAGLDSVTDAINKLLKSYGITVGDVKHDKGFNYLAGAAHGGVVSAKTIKKNGDDGIASLKIGEVVMTDRFTALMPRSIDAMEAFSQAYDSISQSVPFSTSTQNIQPLNIEFSAPLITIGQADSATAADIKKLVPDIAKQVSKEIYKDIRKRGYK